MRAIAGALAGAEVSCLRRPAALVIATAAPMLALPLLLAPASIAAPSTMFAARAHTRTATKPQDAAATRAYLLATVAFEEAELANAPGSKAALEAVAARISAECPGILASAPPMEPQAGLTGVTGQTPMSPRAQGELNRQSAQRLELKLELSIALEVASSQLNREATTALIAALKPLRWTNPTITALVHLTAASATTELELPVPDVCADMREWVASGYKTLSPLSKQVASATDALFGDSLELFAIAAKHHLKPLTELLERYENAPDRALAVRSQALTSELNSSSVETKKTRTDLEATIGLPAPKPQTKLLPTPKKPPVVARGRTAAGGKFVVRAEGRSRKPDPVGCSTFVTIEEPSHPEGLLELLSSGGGTSRCLSRARVKPEPAVRCNSGLLTVEANLLPAARSVRLLLSDGSTITSPAVHVPAHLGGPAGVYYQVVRGPSPIPVSLTELDGHGATLAVLKLPAIVECTKHLIKQLPGGVATLARASLPQGPSFTISGERYRKLGADHFKLELAVSNEGSEPLIGGGGGQSFASEVEAPNASDGRFNPFGQPFGPGGLVFASQASSACLPQPYAIVYGLLREPSDSVLARVSGRLVPLREVSIPARLHAGGTLAYGAFSPLPSELLVRNASGKTVASQNLGEAALSTTEICEGEAE